MKAFSGIKKASRRKSISRPKPRKKVNAFTFKILLCLAVLMLATIVKFINFGPVSELKAVLGRSIANGANPKEMMAAVSRILVSGDGVDKIMEDEAVRVFGNQFLNLDGDRDVAVVSDASAQETEDNAETEEPENPSESSVSEQKPSDTGLKAASSSGMGQASLLLEQITKNSSDLSKSISFLKYAGDIDESQMPETLEDVLSDFPLSEEDATDDTKSGAFEIPSPDKVDNTKYKLPFSYKKPLASGRITSTFGYRDHPIADETRFHYGLDIANKKGTAITSFAAGTVLEIGYGSINGKYVKIQHTGGYWTLYAHCNTVNVKKGQKIKIGQKIATVGSTGSATGPHLHFEIRKDNAVLNPLHYISY